MCKTLPQKFRRVSVAELFAHGRVPLTGDEIAGEIEVPEAKSFAMLEMGDVVIGRMASGAGYGCFSCRPFRAVDWRRASQVRAWRPDCACRHR